MTSERYVRKHFSAFAFGVAGVIVGGIITAFFHPGLPNLKIVALNVDSAGIVSKPSHLKATVRNEGQDPANNCRIKWQPGTQNADFAMASEYSEEFSLAPNEQRTFEMVSRSVFMRAGTHDVVTTVNCRDQHYGGWDSTVYVKPG